MASTRPRPRRALVWLLAGALGLSGCEIIVRFDRDRIEDGGVRPDGEVVGAKEG